MIQLSTCGNKVRYKLWWKAGGFFKFICICNKGTLKLCGIDSRNKFWTTFFLYLGCNIFQTNVEITQIDLKNFPNGTVGNSPYKLYYETHAGNVCLRRNFISKERILENICTPLNLLLSTFLFQNRTLSHWDNMTVQSRPAEGDWLRNCYDFENSLELTEN
jgi:hypothetical protein